MSNTAEQASELNPLPKTPRVSSDLRRILHNAGWMMGEQVIRLLAGIFVGAWIARRLGPAEFGLLSYTQAFAGLFAIVASLGFNRLVVRELVENRQHAAKQATIVQTAFAFRLITAIVLYMLALSISTLTQAGDGSFLVALVGISILVAPFDCTYQYFQAESRSRIPVLARATAFSISTLIKIGLLLAGAGLYEIAYAIAVEYLLTALFLSNAYRRYGSGMKASPDWAMGLRFVRESWPEIIAAFSGLLFMRLDQIMLQALRGEHAVGIFAVAAKLSEAWYFIPVSLVASSFPKIIQSRSNLNLYYSQISRLMVALVALSYAAGLAALLLSGIVIGWLYGAEYSDSASILSVHIWCGLFVALGQVSGAWIMAERRVVLNLQRNLFGLVTNVILNLILIPRFGAIGAAWATFISMASAYYVYDILNPATRHMFRIKTRALILKSSRNSGTSAKGGVG